VIPMFATPRSDVGRPARWPVLLLALATALVGAAARTDAACTVTVNSTVAFGTYNVFAAAPLETTGQISFRCTRNSHPNVQVSLTRGGSTTWTSRRLTMGGEVLLYNIYRDAARTMIWVDGSPGTYVYTGVYPGTGRVYLSLFGRIPAEQDAAVGAYTDTVTVVINF
jgi:spore coat protein U-like protein